MTKTILVIVIAICGLTKCGISQTIKSIDVTFSKTTSLLFQYPIINVDRGSDDVIAQKVKGVENALQIKAARVGFNETNLTVITADGKLHHFYVTYSERPLHQTFKVDSTTMNVELSPGLNMKFYERKVKQILRNKGGKHERKSKFKIQFTLKGIYVANDVIFYDLEIRNKSNINFDIQSLRFFIRDNKKMKRTASQENEVNPIFISDNASQVKGKSKIRVVYALQKFTIPDSKTLDIELFENNGGRNLRLRIDNQTIVTAEKLPN